MLTLKDKKEIYQWDSGVKLNINSPCTEVHFSNVLYGDAITALVKGNEVEIPNELLTKAESFFCWCYVSDNQGGYTVDQKRFNVKQRPKPTGYIYTPSEKATVEQLAKDAVDKALESGMKGDNVYIRYSAYADGTDFTEEWSDGQDYIGISVSEKEAPADKREYEWSLFSLMGEGKKEITDYIDKEIAKFDFIKVVDALPEEGLPNKIYLIPNGTSDNQNLFDEWIFVNDKWEWITTKEIEVDLTDYATIEYVDSTMEDTSDALDEIIEIQNTLVDGGNPNTSWLIDKIYPVGSIYMSVNDINPDVIFGGTWEKLSNAFLLGAGDKYALGAEGGAETVALTVEQMPRHGHAITSDFGSGSMGQRIDNNASTGVTGIAPSGGFVNGTRVGTASITASGGSQPHDNMPPYLAVNMWKRTA